jgi:hypothetical protein
MKISKIFHIINFHLELQRRFDESVAAHRSKENVPSPFFFKKKKNLLKLLEFKRRMPFNHNTIQDRKRTNTIAHSMMQITQFNCLIF